MNIKYRGKTSLHVAAAHGADIVEFLYQNGASVDATDDKGNTAITIASERGHGSVGSFSKGSAESSMAR